MKRTVVFAFCCFLLVGCGIKVIAESGHRGSESNEIAYLSSTPTNVSTEKSIAKSTYLSELFYLEIDDTNDPDKPSNPLNFKKINKVKQVADSTYQTVIEEEGSISFYTWKEASDAEIKFIDIAIFNNQEQAHGLRIGKFYYQIWHEMEDFFLSYHDLELDLTFIHKANHGRIPTSAVNIGMSNEDVVSMLGEPVVIDWYHGGTYYHYNKLAFIFSDLLEVVAIKMPGNRISIRLKDVPTILGEPSEIIYDELDNTLFYSYKLDKFTLSFEAENKEKHVQNVWLMENWE